MMLKVLPWVSVASILFVSLVEKIHALSQTPTCGDTEICFLQPNQLPNISCDCSQSTQCSWSRFADRGKILSNGTTESVLMWQGRYGQYICVGDGSTVAKNIMILPQSKEIKTINVWCTYYVWWGRGSITYFIICLSKSKWGGTLKVVSSTKLCIVLLLPQTALNEWLLFTYLCNLISFQLQAIACFNISNDFVHAFNFLL